MLINIVFLLQRNNYMIINFRCIQQRYVPEIRQNGKSDRLLSTVQILKATCVYPTKTSLRCQNSVTVHSRQQSSQVKEKQMIVQFCNYNNKNKTRFSLKLFQLMTEYKMNILNSFQRRSIACFQQLWLPTRKGGNIIL